jgi:hypothetical protein
MRWNESRQEAFRRLHLVLRRYRAVLFPTLDALAWASPDTWSCRA